MITERFLYELKQRTEASWNDSDLDRSIYGFQFQRGTRWNPGLNENDILDFEAAVQTNFPDDFKIFLRVMNGTDIPTLNIYGDSGEPHRHSTGFYVYPRDFGQILSMMKRVEAMSSELRLTLAEEGLRLPERYCFLPIYAHRFLLCTKNPTVSTVVSIWNASDAIIYGKSLAEYLDNELPAART